MNVEACRNALGDAGIEKARGRCAVRQGADLRSTRSMYGQKLAEALGLQPRGRRRLGPGRRRQHLHDLVRRDGDRGRAVRGRAGLLRRQSEAPARRQAYEKAWGDDAAYGWFGVAAGYAMIAQRHMAEFGTTARAASARSPSPCRNHGAANPHAQLRMPLTLEQYIAVAAGRRAAAARRLLPGLRRRRRGRA